ncbi:MAG TPA: DUF882 domain-containing protein [Candidatus Binatia bacterium]|nr:DUF882 domain-containing protein [Candidatus Binatia bacterium]
MAAPARMRRSARLARRRATTAALLAIAAALAIASPAAAGETSRFFLSGDGEVSLQNGHTGDKLHVRYRRADGSYDAQSLAAVDRFFRSRGDDDTTRVALRLIETIDYLEDRERPRAIVLVSGYRSGEYNSSLIARGHKAARTSMHTEGLAADLRFVGLDQRALWIAVRELECCGAGWYATNGFLHLDVGRPRFWEETTSRVGENLSQGNARVIARTDFDRYDALDGATVALHAVTLRPLRLARDASFVADGEGAAALRVRIEKARRAAEAGDGAAASDCLEFPASSDPSRIVLRVAEADGSGSRAGATRGRIVLRTCEPRLEATPATIDTNPIEVGAPVRSGGGEGRA